MSWRTTISLYGLMLVCKILMLFCTFKLFHNSEKGGNAFYFVLTPKYPVSQWTQIIVYNPTCKQGREQINIHTEKGGHAVTSSHGWLPFLALLNAHKLDTVEPRLMDIQYKMDNTESLNCPYIPFNTKQPPNSRHPATPYSRQFLHCQ